MAATAENNHFDWAVYNLKVITAFKPWYSLDVKELPTQRLHVLYVFKTQKDFVIH